MAFATVSPQAAMAPTKKSKEEEEKKIQKTKPETQKPTKPNDKNKAKTATTSNVAKSLRDKEVLVVSSSSCDAPEVIGEYENGSVESPKKDNKRKGKAKIVHEEEDDGLICRFPTARIKRIMEQDDPGLQLSQDIVFLVNKATDKFLEQFCEEAYECSVRDRKKSLAYKHLATVVSKRRRYDFLSDFVPQKLKAEDALAQRNSGETGQS